MLRFQIRPPWFISLFALLLIARTTASAQTTILFDSFEGNANLTNRWSVYDGYDPESEPISSWGIVGNSFGRGSATIKAARTGTNKVYCAAIGYAGSTTSPQYPSETSSTVMEREINLTGYKTATLSFWYKCRIPDLELFSDYMTVYVDDVQVFSTDALYEPVTNWAQVIVSLDEFVGETHTLKFEFDTDPINEPDLEWDPPIHDYDFEGVYLDDVLVVGAKEFYKPDFNNDGYADLLWQNKTGVMATWFMQGSVYTSSLVLRSGTPIAKGWTSCGTSDLDQNGTADIVFNHSNGSVATWLMNGTNVLKSMQLRKAAIGWRLAAITDFDNDGKRDFIWQYTDNRMALWKMNGTNFVSNTALAGGVTSVGKLVGVHDFNWDGKKDLLFQRASDGYLFVWLMDGSKVLNNKSFIDKGTSGVKFTAGWKVMGMHDFDGDGQIDLFMQNSDNTVAIWYLNGRTILHSQIIKKLSGTGWFAVGPKN